MKSITYAILDRKLSLSKRIEACKNSLKNMDPDVDFALITLYNAEIDLYREEITSLKNFYDIVTKERENVVG